MRVLESSLNNACRGISLKSKLCFPSTLGVKALLTLGLKTPHQKKLNTKGFFIKLHRAIYFRGCLKLLG